MKFVLDKIFAILILIVLSPILIIVTILLLIRFKGKPFYLQYRIGFNNEVFKIFKFRKMTEDRDSEGNLLPEEKRITAIGKFLRLSSLDEIPQFINVLLGQMSIIGPRPLLAEYLPYYTPKERQRHLVRPGITGWAQINGYRPALNWEKKFEYDLEYVKKISFLFDLKIVVKTITTIFTSSKPIDITKEGKFTEDRAYIRLVKRNDNFHALKKLLKKDKNYNNFEKSIFDLIYIDDNKNYNNKVKNNISNLMFIDDYNGTYNSFFYITIKKDFVKIENYYISDQTFLPKKDMFEKYLNVIKIYLSDMELPKKIII